MRTRFLPTVSNTLSLGIVALSIFPALAFAQLQSAPSPQSQTSSSALANNLNPDISLDGLFSFAQFNTAEPVAFTGGHDPKNNGFNLQQIELTLGAAVDPYFRGDANLVWVQEKGEIKTEIEEAYLTTLSLPLDLQLKAGTFFSAFGRHNPTHPHTWDWADKPLVLGKFFGGDGLRNPGAQVSWLAPTPWYAEFIYSAQNSTGDTAQPFLSGGSPIQQRSFTDLMHLFRMNHFFAITDAWSLNLGASEVFGLNDMTQRKNTYVTGADLFVKFRPETTLQFVTLQAEIVQRRVFAMSGRLDDWGFYVQPSYRFAQRWIAGVRYDWTSAQKLEGGGINDRGLRSRVSPVITFYPSEFSKIRLQYNADRLEALLPSQHAVFLQFEFLIGAHGAHKF